MLPCVTASTVTVSPSSVVSRAATSLKRLPVATSPAEEASPLPASEAPLLLYDIGYAGVEWTYAPLALAAIGAATIADGSSTVTVWATTR